MTVSTLAKAISAQTPDAASKTAWQECADERPHASTRELEAVFAEQGDRMPTAGLALGLAISAGLWAVIASLVF